MHDAKEERILTFFSDTESQPALALLESISEQAILWMFFCAACLVIEKAFAPVMCLIRRQK